MYRFIAASPSTAHEENMDPATRLAMMRRRKQREPAATKLDTTLHEFFDWVKQANTENQQVFERAVERVGKIMESAVVAFDRAFATSCESCGECNIGGGNQ